MTARRRRGHARSIAILAAISALGGLAPAAKAVKSEPPPPSAAPAYAVHGTVYVPTSIANGIKCPDNSVLMNSTNSSWLVPRVTPGRVFSLRAEDATYHNDFDIRFFRSLASCQAGEAPLPHLNHPGDEHAVVPDGAAVGVVTLATGRPAAFTYAEQPVDPFRPGGRAGVTVVALIETLEDGGYGIYHQDFLGSHHPWNLDLDQTNNIDFTEPPSTYIPGMPTVTPITLNLPKTDDDEAVVLARQDSETWAGLRGSTEAQPNLYWFPGTKVVAAADFSGPGSTRLGAVERGRDGSEGNDSHASHVASAAAGNVHGTCPECVFVLLRGGPTALAWATKQPWIDVITNSYLTLTSPAGLDAGVYAGPEHALTKQATEAGQTIFWGAGNGLTNLFMEGPTSTTYEDSQRGPDWVVTVGGVSNATDQPFRGSGRPADIASYASRYPTMGGPTVSSSGWGGGTSISSPVVAGTFAKIISLGRQLLGDGTPGHANGVVATGTAVPCAPSSAPCPLGDGRLDRAEVQALLFDNVLPSSSDLSPSYVDQGEPPPGQNVTDTATSGPTTEFRPASQGRGIVFGRLDRPRFVAEQRRFSDALLGAIVPHPRPFDQRAWIVADSKCRQQLWGRWDGGAYAGTAPTFQLPDDAPAQALYAACDQLPPDLLLRVGPLMPVPKNLVGL